MNENINLVLAIGTVVAPICYGFLIYKMTEVFVTQKEYIKDQATTAAQRADVKADLSEMKCDIKEILTNSAFAKN